MLNVFWNDGSLRKTFRAATFPFPANALTESHPVKALGKITSKISGNVGNINEPSSVLSASFHINGNTNDVCLWYCYWKNISIFANYNNALKMLFRLWSIFGMQKNSCVCFFVIASQIWHFFDVFSCNSETIFIISKIHFSSLQFWSKVDLLLLVAQKSNNIQLVIRVLYKLTPLFNFMVW